MAIGFNDRETRDIGSWQELFKPTISDRVKRLREDALTDAGNLSGAGPRRDESLRAIQE